MKILGIDPGANGGLVIVDEDRRILAKIPMPLTGKKEIDIYGIDAFVHGYERLMTYVEHSQAIPGKISSSAAFSFGRNFGEVIGWLKGRVMPFILVKPRVWQAVTHRGVVGDGPKARSAVAASRLFPGVDFRSGPKSKRPHDGMIDAALIAYFGSTHG